MGDGTLRLRAALEPRGPVGAIVLTDDQVALLGGGKTPPVTVTVNGVTVQHRKEFSRWIDEAKRDETRDSRVQQAVQMLHEGRTR